MADQEDVALSPDVANTPAEKASAIPGDSAAQEGASMGEHCVSDRPLTSGITSTGELSKIAGVDVYISKPTDYPHSPSKLLLLLTSGTGIASKNNQLQADKFAAEGFLVVMPDQFDGDPAPKTTTEAAAQADATFIEQIKLKAAETAKSFLIDMWLARHTPEKVMPRLLKVVDGVKDEFADAISSGGGIYAVGYCFGAKYALILGGEHAQDPGSGGWRFGGITSAGEGSKGGDGDEEQVAKRQTSGPHIKAGAVAHGTLVTREDLEAVRVPMYLGCVENDPLFPDDIREAGREALQRNSVEHELTVFEGAPHGFAVFGEYDDAHIQNAQYEAFGQMLAWLKNH